MNIQGETITLEWDYLEVEITGGHLKANVFHPVQTELI